MNECSEIESILCNTTLNNIDHYDRDYRMIHNPPVLAGDRVTKDVCTQRALKIPQHLNPLQRKVRRFISFLVTSLSFGNH